ncbi:MAG: hypothetical protein Tsb0010_09010 [Parvularculaceae bacterium]
MTQENALIGHTGFVGGNLARQAEFDACFNSKNIEEISGRAFDRLVFSGAQAKKWWANQNPEEDWAGIARALAAMRDVTAARPVLISTVDVLGASKPLADEAAPVMTEGLHAYGLNRLRLEEAFRAQFPHGLIVRLPGLFGPGLKKNVLYDLAHDNILDKINPASSFQYYDLGRLAADIETAEKADLKLVHLFAAPVATREVVDRFFPGKEVGSDAAPEAHYDYRTRHGALFGGDGCYIESAESVIARMARFFESEYGLKSQETP